ncbi:acid-sensing ion channel 4-A [Cylas formicarius]|uniref:acid-sensing ion channel 4-A n=1 Tax=Cylas formicarius TaxID=197179 RepID=UPI00295881D7|nr:acid-sensing ion channel 4-A [Cylas formicarius]
MSAAELKKCFSDPIQLLKLIILTVCVFVSFYQTAQCIWKLINPPISTYYRFYLNETMRYPSVTICRRPGFKTDLFSKYGLKTTKLLAANAFRNFNFDDYTIQEFLNETTYTFAEVFGSYAFGGTGNQFADVDISSFQTLEFGRCFTFIPKRNSETFNMGGGWFFYLNHNHTVRRTDEYGQSLTGFHLYLHNENEVLDTESTHGSNLMQYLDVQSAELLNVQLKLKEYYKISTSSNPCVSGQDKYSRSKCIERCHQKQILELANCTLPWIFAVPPDQSLPQCSSSTDVSYLVSGFTNHNRSRLLSNCDCQISCNVSLFSASIVNRRDVEDRNYPDSIVTIHYPTNLVSFMSEELGYDWNDLLSDIGGSLGFLLGLSVVGIIGVLGKLLCFLLKLHLNKQQDSQSIGSHNEDCQNKENQNYLNNSSTGNEKRTNVKLYDNLRDFDSLDLKCYEKTHIVDA